MENMKSLDEKIAEITKLAKSDTFSNLSKNHRIIKLREVITMIDEIRQELKIIRSLTQDHLIDLQLTSQMKMFDSSMNEQKG